MVLDTSKMVIRLPVAKKEKGLAIIRKHKQKASLSLPELQEVTGFLNFTTLVVPLGRAFLRRLYNLQLLFPPGHLARRWISAEAQKDLLWWSNLLGRDSAIERLFMPVVRRGITMWTDASGLKGLGGYYRDQEEAQTGRRGIPPSRAFMLALPRHIQRKHEHINSKEMRAVKQGLLRWGARWKGSRVTLNIDNKAVVHGIENRTIRGGTMAVLRRCLLLASVNDLELNPRWIPTENNELADVFCAISEFPPLVNIRYWRAPLRNIH